jgi:prepilin-type processing-associated H-X9-DG protein
MEYAKIHKRFFVCLGSGTRLGQCSYAMNKNIAGAKKANISSDTVVLYESTAGWNKSGGQELLNTANHYEAGCHILFNDGHVEFVKPERLAELKWKVEKDENRGAEKKP